MTNDLDRAAWELELDTRLADVWGELLPGLELLELSTSARLAIGAALRTTYALGYRAGVDEGRRLGDTDELPELARRYFELMGGD